MRLIPILCLLGACAAPPVTDWVSIHQGVYGALTTYCDTNACSGDTMLDHEQVLVEDAAGAQTLDMTTSDGNGYYELALAPGDYRICLQGTNCGAFSIQPDQRAHMDFEAGPGGGMWTPVTP